jgi:hypothetical protein
VGSDESLLTYTAKRRSEFPWLFINRCLRDCASPPFNHFRSRLLETGMIAGTELDELAVYASEPWWKSP